MVPAARVEEVIVSGGTAGAATASDIATEVACAGLPLSLTVAVKLDVAGNLAIPLPDGVPEISPPDDSVMPAGRLPEVIVHE